MAKVDPLRVSVRNEAPVDARGAYVLYWMVACRRAVWSHALDRAAEHCRDLGKPLLVFEPLRAGYRWASPRLHAFVLQGMAENARRFEKAGVRYYPYVEPSHGEGRGLLEALAARACLVVTDELPTFFLPRMIAAAAARLPVRLEAVDGNGLLPLRAVERFHPRAPSFRRLLHEAVLDGAVPQPAPAPLGEIAALGRATVPAAASKRWPSARRRLGSDGLEPLLASLSLSEAVPPVSSAGGADAAEARLATFLDDKLGRYHEDGRHPDRDGTSGLSPYLHFGHLSSMQVLDAVLRTEGWGSDRLSPASRGKREGFWGLSPGAEAFLDELLTWRELSYSFAFLRPEEHRRFEAVPAWARKTLAAHGSDRREHLYSLEELAAAETGDPIWNAAQRQLLRDGTIHGYLRMLWGKRVLEWSPSPEEAFEVLVELNNRYAVDGRDPCSYSGILWTFGLFDRAWGPERPIFGTVRYMSSEATPRKLRMREYLERYGAEG